MKIGDLMWGIFPIEENKRLFPLLRVCPAVFLGEEKGWIICDKGDARVGWPHWHKEDRQTLIFETKEEADEVMNLQSGIIEMLTTKNNIREFMHLISHFKFQVASLFRIKT